MCKIKRFAMVLCFVVASVLSVSLNSFGSSSSPYGYSGYSPYGYSGYGVRCHQELEKQKQTTGATNGLVSTLTSPTVISKEMIAGSGYGLYDGLYGGMLGLYGGTYDPTTKALAGLGSDYGMYGGMLGGLTSSPVVLSSMYGGLYGGGLSINRPIPKDVITTPPSFTPPTPSTVGVNFPTPIGVITPNPNLVVAGFVLQVI
jgi:hypothetical protein